MLTGTNQPNSKIISHPRCFANCEHWSISHDLKKQAQEDESNMRAEKKYSTTTHGIVDHWDYKGSIAHNGTIEKIELGYGILLDFKQPYYVPGLAGDEVDFRHRGMGYDVKGSQINDFDRRYGINTRTRVGLYEHQKEKYVNYYVFSKIDLELDMIHVLGAVSYEDFWNETFWREDYNQKRYMKTGVGKDNKPYTLYMRDVYILKPFRQQIYGV